jgi:hypothetical protein
VVITVADVPVHSRLSRAASVGVGSLLIGGGSLPTEVWTSLPGVAELSVLLAAHDAVSGGTPVIVDAGTFDAVGRLVALPSLCLRILDSLLTPDVAMLRASGDETPFEALSALRSELHRVARMLRDSGTVARLASDVEDDALSVIREADLMLATHGVAVDGVVVVRGPRERDEADALVARVEMLGITAWSTGRRRRPAPSGERVNAVLSSPRETRFGEIEVRTEGDRLIAVVPLAADRVGIDDDHLVIDVAGGLRWLPLPSVLTRSSVVGAHRRRGTVEIVFEPDATRWRPAS